MNRSRRDGGPSDKLDGYLHLTWHGAHDGGDGDDRDIYAKVPIADGVVGGQYELCFCSTDCLRAFLNAAIYELEQRIAAEKTHGQK